MSLKQAGAFAEAAERAWVRENRARAVLADGAVKLLLSGIGRMVDKTVRVPKVEEMFPQWFGDGTKAEPARSDAEVWMDFLGIGGVGVLLYQNWETVKSVAVTVWTYIKDFFSEVGRTIQNDVTALVERFTDFGSSVKQVFEDLWDRLKIIINAVLGGIEKMANGVIKGVNTMIKALNGLSFDVPDWVPGIGGETFGFSIKTLSEISIPRLATGAVITSPTLGLMGEYPNAASNPEIVTPQKLLYETVTSANAEQNALLREQNNLLRQLLKKESTVNIGASAALGKVNRRSEELYAALVGG